LRGEHCVLIDRQFAKNHSFSSSELLLDGGPISLKRTRLDSFEQTIEIVEY
jgi:hypothetical protein